MAHGGRNISTAHTLCYSKSSLCWTGAQETQQPSRPTTPSTPTAQISFGGVGAWWLLSKVTEGGIELNLFLIKSEELSSSHEWRSRSSVSATRRHRALILLSASLEGQSWGHCVLISTTAYSPCDYIYPCKLKRVMDHPLAPSLLRHSCPQSRRLCLHRPVQIYQ